MQNNFNHFNYLFDYEADEFPSLTFYNITVVKRHKDSDKNSNSTIKQYFVCNLEEYEKYQQEIITLCEVFGARAYIDIQPRDFRDFALELNMKLAERMLSNDYEKIQRVFYRAATSCKRINSYWVLDVDDPNDIEPLESYLGGITNVTDFFDIPRARIIDKVKTNSGYHIITDRFDTREFSEKFPNVEIKKNNSTLLYYPQSLTHD